MRISKKAKQLQLSLVDRKIKDMTLLRSVQRPRSGWLKAVREALGISARHIAERLDITHQAVLKLETSETTGAASLGSLERYAKAMDCILVYAIVPKAPFESLDDLLEKKADALARKIFQQVSHSMRLEDQSVGNQDSERQLQQLKNELKSNLDPRLWGLKKNEK
jgi:predicted DNA-binding mobile mystery protein A